MYKYLKQVLALADRLGRTENIRLDNKSSVYGDRIYIDGRTESGEKFTVTVSVQEDQDDRNQS